jgi:hypothetical protein
MLRHRSPPSFAREPRLQADCPIRNGREGWRTGSREIRSARRLARSVARGREHERGLTRSADDSTDLPLKRPGPMLGWSASLEVSIGPIRAT